MGVKGVNIAELHRPFFDDNLHSFLYSNISKMVVECESVARAQGVINDAAALERDVKALLNVLDASPNKSSIHVSTVAQIFMSILQSSGQTSEQGAMITAACANIYEDWSKVAIMYYLKSLGGLNP